MHVSTYSHVKPLRLALMSVTFTVTRSSCLQNRTCLVRIGHGRVRAGGIRTLSHTTITLWRGTSIDDTFRFPSA
eukprot:1851302-Rhodomonas_salina.4